MKPENWIKWDLDSRAGIKMAAYFGEFGALGYGAFLFFTESLYRNKDHKLGLNQVDLDIYAVACKTSSEQVKQMLDALFKYGLFANDGDYFWSERVIKEIDDRGTRLRDLNENKSKAGKLGAEKRWGKQAIADDGRTIADDSKGMAKIARERGERDKIISLDKSKDICTPIWKGCEFLRMTQEESRKVLAVYQKRKYPIELLSFAVEVLDGWLAGTSTEAIKARKQDTHYRRLYAEWVLKKAQGLYKLADKPAGGEQRLTNMQKAENLLKKARTEETYDQGRNGRDVAIHGSYVASNGSERVSPASADGSLFGGKCRVDEKGNITLSKSGVSTID